MLFRRKNKWIKGNRFVLIGINRGSFSSTFTTLGIFANELIANDHLYLAKGYHRSQIIPVNFRK